MIDLAGFNIVRLRFGHSLNAKLDLFNSIIFPIVKVDFGQYLLSLSNFLRICFTEYKPQKSILTIPNNKAVKFQNQTHKLNEVLNRLTAQCSFKRMYFVNYDEKNPRLP